MRKRRPETRPMTRRPTASAPFLEVAAEKRQQKLNQGGRPDRSVWEFLKGFLNGYDAAIFTLREFIPPDFPLDRVAVVPPAIDLLSPKSIPLPDMIARQVLGWIGVETDRPLLTQGVTIRSWKDPMG